MSWDSNYLVPSHKTWHGRSDVPDGSCFFQIIEMLNLLKDIPKPYGKLAFGLIGFSCDEGIRRNFGRTGALEGPSVTRETLAKMPVQKQHFICYDAGDITTFNHDLETAQTALGEAVAIMLKNGIIPIVMGGGHELAWGNYQGVAKQFPKENLAIINFDAHFDMRPLLPHDKGSSGTPFLQIAEAHKKAHRRFDYNCIGIQHAGNIRSLFETAKQNHTQFILADDLHQGYTEKCVNFIDRAIDLNQIVYLSICLDVFASAFAPGVSAPQSLGVTPWQIIPLLRQIAASGKVVSYDIAELSPKYDIDNRTAKLAANLIYEIIHHHNS